MDKLYTLEKYRDKLRLYTLLNDSEPPKNLQKKVKDQHGRVITYNYVATGAKTLKSYYSTLSRKIVGWFLYIISFSLLKNNSVVTNLMRGKRIDHIYQIHSDIPIFPPPEQCEIIDPIPIPTKKEEYEIELRPTGIQLNKLFFNNNLYNTNLVFELLRFAESEQNIFPILDKYNEQYIESKTSEEKDNVITNAALEIIEQSLNVTFGINVKDNKLIIKTFIKRLICRGYHGTSIKAVKNILEKGICFSGKHKNFDENELKKLFTECGLDRFWFPFAERDTEHFYVSYIFKTAKFYAQSNCPEFFLNFRRWGSNEKGEFDPEKFKINCISNNPNISNIERIIAFAQNHWHLSIFKKRKHWDSNR